MKTITISGLEASVTLLAAFRYALSQQKYIPSLVADLLEKHWTALSDSDRQQIHDNIYDALERGTVKAVDDMETWERVLSLPVS